MSPLLQFSGFKFQISGESALPDFDTAATVPEARS